MMQNLKKQNVLKKKASFKDILSKESHVQDQTYQAYGKWFVKFGQSIDILLELCYLECDLSKLSSAENDFMIYVSDAYYELPLSFRSCSVLMEKGLYHDALNCCRALIENLVRYKYLFNHKNQSNTYMIKGKDDKGKKIRIIDMFEYVAGPDSYNKIYKFLSKFEHKNFGTSLPRLIASLQSRSSFSLIPVFDKILAEVIINNLMFLLFGYINLSKMFFPFKFDHADPKFLNNYNDIKNFLDMQIKKKKSNFPQSAEWLQIMEKIVY